MPKFSVVYLTYRPGSYDMLADSLLHQTCQDYELICIDEMVERKQIVQEYLLSSGVKLSAISPSKPKCFPELSYGLHNAQNTGVMFSRGEYIIILNDYIWLPPDALEKFLRYEELLKRDICISGVAVTINDYHKKYLDHLISIWDISWKGNPIRNGYELHSLWRPTFFEMFYSAFSYSTLVKMNGFMECYDYDEGTSVISVIQKANEINVSFYVDETNICYAFNHKDWGKDSDPGLWWFAYKPETGPKELILRENTFDLKTHERGMLPINVIDINKNSEVS